MNFAWKPGRNECVMLLAAAAVMGCSAAERVFDVTPAPTTLPASRTKFVQFHFTHRITEKTSSVDSFTVAFQIDGAKPDSPLKSCRIRLAKDGSVVLANSAGAFQNAAAGRKQSRQVNGQCAVGPGATVVVRPDGSLEGSVPIAFTKAGKYKLYARSSSSGWTGLGDYAMEGGDSTPGLTIQIKGVTPTQALLAFAPPTDTDSCSVMVTTTKSESGWDYSTLVPDTDPGIFPGADNASLNDSQTGVQNRGFALPGGGRAIVIGKRAAEYSPNTFKMHSRALQAATPHEAWITCGESSGVVDFTTANVMTGISYSDPLPADPDRPGDYAYPTISWTNRSEGAVDPQTGLMLHPVTLPTDSIFSGDTTSENTGKFGVPIAAYPARGLPSNSLFLPANINSQVPAWFNFLVDQNHTGYNLVDYSLMSFLPTSLTIGCPGCSDTPITVCLTADGISCAVDRSVAADPNSNMKGALGVTFNCTGNCSFPIADARWSDRTPNLAAWHPNYSPDTPHTVAPSFQFDSVKLRTSQAKCSDSPVVSRGTDAPGASFSPLWKNGTPVFIDGVRYTINQVYDENSILLNETCPASAKTLTADTFGLLVTAPANVSITGVVPGQWKAKFHEDLTIWDAGGDLGTFTNCGKQPVFAGGQAGWHCTIGYSLYWIAADGSSALPLGGSGVPSRPDLGNSTYCLAAFWDDLDGNTLNCVTYAATRDGRHVLARMTFYGDYAGLENAQYTSPDSGGGNSYLPACKSTNPPTPNNCWGVSVAKTTGTDSVMVIEDAIRDGAPNAWKNSAFPAAMGEGGVYTYVNAKINDSNLMVTTWLGKESYGFNSILELSVPRGTARIRAVNPSWTAPVNISPNSKVMRWAALHSTSGNPWGPTRVSYSPAYFGNQGGGSGAGQGPYRSGIVSTAAAACPQSVDGVCLSITIDGQPGDPDPHRFDPKNDAKTRKPGTGYLQDLAPGDLMCAPKDDDFGSYCTNYITNGRFEQLRVLSTSSNPDGTVVVTALRNVGNTVTMPLPAGQKLFMLPTLCDYSAGYGCLFGAVVWDWVNGTIEQFSNGGGGHQFTTFEPSQSQVVSIAAAAGDGKDEACYSSSTAFYANCYSVLTGRADATKALTAQVPSFFQGLITMNPPFGVALKAPGLTGVGTPNDVDSHPGAMQIPTAPASGKNWFVDGRPFLGFYTSTLTPPEQTSPGVYRFAASKSRDQNPIESYKRLPMLGSCGTSVLRDVTRISDQTPYSYCLAINAGDCATGSVPGDAYVSCPSVNPAAKPNNACPFPGVGGYAPEVRDTCLTTTGPYTMGLTQVGFAAQSSGVYSPLTSGQLKRSTRLLTHGLSRYRIVDQFWNPKTTPDGGVLLFRAGFLNGYSTQIMMARIPPFPDIAADPLDRRGYVPTPAVIDPGPAGAASVKVQFGYDPTFRCMSRNEACEARADFDATGGSTPFYFASESGPAGLSCVGRCQASVDLPGISQRVMYYRPVYQVDGSPVYGVTRVVAVPDPVIPPGN